MSKIFAEGTLVDEAVRCGVRAAIRQHRRVGVPMVVRRDGRMMHIPAEQLESELKELERAGRPRGGDPDQG